MLATCLSSTGTGGPAYVSYYNGSFTSSTTTAWIDTPKLPAVTAPSPLYSKADIDDTFHSILCLLRMREGWNGKDFARPNPYAIANALNFVMLLFNDAVAGRLPWISPNATANADGDVVLEWWAAGSKKLTTYFMSDGTAEYIKSWGPDVESEMEDGILDTERADAAVIQESPRYKLWDWLVK